MDFKLISATHRDLKKEIASGSFRQDLYYRINVIEIDVPKLRDRKSDIPLLANHILQRIAEECEVYDAKISDEAMNSLKEYHFPGNVRELENIIERAFTLCENDIIETSDLQLRPSNKTDGTMEFSETSAQRDDETSLEDFLEGIERKTIEQALEETRWNKTAAAKKLGITFRALRYRLKKLNME